MGACWHKVANASSVRTEGLRQVIVSNVVEPHALRTSAKKVYCIQVRAACFSPKAPLSKTETFPLYDEMSAVFRKQAMCAFLGK